MHASNELYFTYISQYFLEINISIIILEISLCNSHCIEVTALYFSTGALEEGRGRAKVAKAMNIVGPIITVLTVVITVIYVVVVIGSLFF